MKLNKLSETFNACEKAHVENIGLIVDLLKIVNRGFVESYDITDKKEDRRIRKSLVNILDFIGAEFVVSDWHDRAVQFLEVPRTLGFYKND